MATKTATYGYIDIPNSFFASKMPTRNLFALSSVYSFSSPEREIFGIKKKKNYVKFTVSSFAKRYNVSASTSRRALKYLDTCDDIEKTEEGMYFSTDIKKEGYLHVEEWAFFAKWTDGEYLTKSEVLVLFRIISLAKKGIVVKASYRYIARGLGLSHTFVRNACEKLEQLGLIHIITRACNKYNRTILSIDKESVEAKKAETLRTLRGTGKDREEYYKNIRQKMFDRAQAMIQKANTDSEFKETYPKWIADRTNVKLKEIIDERLKVLGMSWEDIRIRRLCKKCKDTGTLPNGEQCNCYEGKMNK